MRVRFCLCARVVQEFEEDESLKKTEADEELCVSLDDCLRMFTADELLEDGSPWYCSVCKAHRSAQAEFPGT